PKKRATPPPPPLLSPLRAFCGLRIRAAPLSIPPLTQSFNGFHRPVDGALARCASILRCECCTLLPQRREFRSGWQRTLTSLPPTSPLRFLFRPEEAWKTATATSVPSNS